MMQSDGVPWKWLEQAVELDETGPGCSVESRNYSSTNRDIYIT